MSNRLSEEALWTSLGLVAPLGARVTGGVPKGGIRGISIDTRTLQPGDLFFAIAGAARDGHEFVEAAFAAGAVAAVVDEAHAGQVSGLGPLYIVRDVLAALDGLAAAARTRTTARIVAVTGSVGKTSTKEALRLVLSAAGSAHASPASYNNHWGVPLTLARMPKRTRFGIFEIGMNHEGEITPLTALVRPHVAIITTIAPVHLEYFSGLDAIADAKSEIFAGLVPGGVAILHRDIPQYERLLAHAKASAAGYVASFGTDPKADASLRNVRMEPDHTIVDATIQGRALTYKLGAPGRHFATNSLAVLLAAKALGLDLEAAAGSLEAFTAPPGRGERRLVATTDGEFTLIDESYNASPVSMRAALELAGALPLSEPGRRIAILGDMLELGDEAAAMHADLVADIEANHIDIVYTAGPLMQELYRALPLNMQGGWRSNAAELEPFVRAAVRAGDIVLVKGSNSSKMKTIIAALENRNAAAHSAQARQIQSQQGLETC
jgi:UDP-N-acetylmuramoyl-tripeptide--D-alanyl-D-alanine ligase